MGNPALNENAVFNSSNTRLLFNQLTALKKYDLLSAALRTFVLRSMDACNLPMEFPRRPVGKLNVQLQCCTGGRKVQRRLERVAFLPESHSTS
jgi:hypothetical protein